MMKFDPIKVLNQLIGKHSVMEGLFDLESLGSDKTKQDIQYYVNRILTGNASKFELDNLDSLIRICLNYYVYSDMGEVLISDHEYDQLMQVWISMGNEPIIYPDIIPTHRTWPMRKHTHVGLVGSIGKIYEEAELVKYLSKYKGITEWSIAPKYDGVSGAIAVENDKMIGGLTRGDGFMGQDITPIINYADNSNMFTIGAYPITDKLYDGFYKCELCISQESFEALVEHKKYANRRSATTGIVNTPKNINLSKYITIIPLLYYDGHGRITYCAPGIKNFNLHPSDIDSNVKIIMKKIDKMLNKIRSSEFPYRTDGVIITPHSKSLQMNEKDFMQDSIAFKVNTNEALSPALYGYVSVGRLANAIPMLKVKSVEVNETVVDDVSLGSFDKFAKLDIREGETVVVYSAGDVIPQVRLPEKRQYDKNAPYIIIKKRCPYCDEKLGRFGLEYRCVNNSCPRVVTGKIANFISKLEVDNISDGTIEALYSHSIIKTIEDLFHMNYKEIADLPGFGVVSASNIKKEIDRLLSREFTISSFFGSLGIPNISEKKCRKIFNYITIKDINTKSRTDLIRKMLNAEGIGVKTANIFVDYIYDNESLIKFLLKTLNIITDKRFKGNVVFTDFRDKDLVKRFESIGYEISNSINSETLAVVSGKYDHSSTKCKEAMRRGIDIVDLIDVEDLISSLQRRG